MACLLLLVVFLSLVWLWTVATTKAAMGRGGKSRSPLLRFVNLRKALKADATLIEYDEIEEDAATNVSEEAEEEVETSSYPGGLRRVYFFAIITQPLQFKRRQIIRGTWLHCLKADAKARGIDVRHRFFIGRMHRVMAREAESNGGYQQLAHEMAQHGDIVPLLNEERYENLTLKSQLMLQWVAREWATYSGQDFATFTSAAGDDGAYLSQMRAYPNGSSFLDWLDDDNGSAPRLAGLDSRQLEAVDQKLSDALAEATAASNGVGSQSSGPGRPWGSPFDDRSKNPNNRAVLEYLVKSDADVHYCPIQLFPYASALLAPHVRWKNQDTPPQLSQQEVEALYASSGAAPQYVWAGKGPYGNKSIIRRVHSERRDATFRSSPFACHLL